MTKALKTIGQLAKNFFRTAWLPFIISFSLTGLLAVLFELPQGYGWDFWQVVLSVIVFTAILDWLLTRIYRIDKALRTRSPEITYHIYKPTREDA